MKVLHLTLKKEWFDMILSGEKKEDYRELKSYWNARLNANTYEGFFKPKQFDVVELANGYSRDSRKIIIQFDYTTVREGLIKWGANAGEKYFVVRFGKILETRNIK